MKINYSFTLPPQTPTPARPAQNIVEHAYNEFLLDLPAHWRQVPAQQQDTLCWVSDLEGASITISIDFYQIPEEKFEQVAEFCRLQRHKAMEQRAPGQVSVLQQSVKPYSGGGALEIVYAAHIPGSTYLYLGYVSGRKIFNFGLTCGPDHAAASALFNGIVSHGLRVKLP